jgi:long-chain fatty acid transport protein
MSQRFLLSLLSIACISLMPASANAASFYLQEQSVSGLGTAFAGAGADTPDASTVYYNPAGMMTLEQPEIQLGASVLLPRADFDDTGSSYTAPIALGGGTSAIGGDDSGNPFSTAIVPHAYGVLPINDRFALGLGLSAPFGLADEYEDDFTGRYNSVQSELKTIDIQPTAAMNVTHWLNIGAGVNIQYVYANLKNKIPEPAVAGPQQADDGQQKLAGDDWSVGYTFGAQIMPTDTTTLGLTYKTSINHRLEGNVDVTFPTSPFLPGTSGTSVEVDGSAKLSTPDIASLAVSQDLNEKWTLLGSINWYGWSKFDNIPVTSGLGNSQAAQNYENTWGFAVGARYRLNDKWLLKGGVQYDQTPTFNEDRSTRIPDGNRVWVAGGATYSLTPQIDLDMAVAYVNVSEKKVEVTDAHDTGTVVTRGDTDGGVGIVAAAIKYKF